MSMHLQRLKVEQLRRFRQPLELNQLSAGLNLLAGPNEAGKSTLVRAIRAAFFERHRSAAVDDLRPWGEGSGATPTVEMDFSLDGQAHRLVKSFLGKKRCSLQIGARTLEGVEAEDHLAQLLGFSFASRGGSKAEHWGIPGLLWVEQGQGQELAVEHAREHLHDALRGQAVGAAAAVGATAGDALLEQLKRLRGELLTSTGRPRGELDEALQLVPGLQAAWQALDGQVAQYRQQVDTLAQVRLQWQRDEAAPPWQALRLELAQVQARQQALQLQEQQWRQDQSRLEQLGRHRQLLQAQMHAESQAQQALAQRQQAWQGAQAQRTQADESVALAQAPVQLASARLAAARHGVQQARAAQQHEQLAQQLAQAEAVGAQLDAQGAQAEAAHQALATLRQQAPARWLSDKDLQTLRQLERQRRDAELRHQGVATRLSYRLLPGQRLARHDAQGEQAALEGQGEVLLDQATTVLLPGGGELSVQPGGQDLAAQRLARDQALSALNETLLGLGLPSLDEAEARLARQQAWQQQVQLAEQALGLVAPKGLELLQQQRAQAQARCTQLRETLAQWPDRPNPTAAVSAADGLRQAEAEEAAALQAEQVAQAGLGAALRQQATAQAQAEQAQRELAAAQQAWDDPARQARVVDAQQQWLGSGEEQAALQQRMDLAARALQEARPDIVAQDLQRLQRSIEQLLNAHQQRREQMLVLDSQLQQASALNLEEQRDAAAGALGRATQRVEELQRRANALDLLCRRLEAKRQATLERLQAPLQQRLEHYLPLLMPGASLQIDAQLAPGTLSRPQGGGLSEAGEVEALSFGAREQLRLISRFAYADLLQQAGRPTLLILDDALVHSDAQRLAQMKRVLFDVAQRHQVLLFTCHPEQWQDLGVAPRLVA